MPTTCVFFFTPRILLNCIVPRFWLWSPLALPNRVAHLCTACFCRKFEKSGELPVTMKPIKDSPKLTKEAVTRGQTYSVSRVRSASLALMMAYGVRYSVSGFLFNEWTDLEWFLAVFLYACLIMVVSEASSHQITQHMLFRHITILLQSHHSCLSVDSRI